MIHIIRNDSWNDGGEEDLRILYSIRGSTSTGVFVWRGNRRRITQGEVVYTSLGWDSEIHLLFVVMFALVLRSSPHSLKCYKSGTADRM